jgi:hypothetical protein
MKTQLSALLEHSTLRQRNLVLAGRSAQSPSSFQLPMRLNHMPHYHRSLHSPPYLSASLFKRLAIELFNTNYNRRLLRWTGHVARMPLTRAPRKILTRSDNPRPLGCPKMDCGRTLKKVLLSNDLLTEFAKRREIAAD